LRKHHLLPIIFSSAAAPRTGKALCSSIEESLKKFGMAPLGIEGEKHGRWALMDYDDVVIHVFLEPLREFYDIERLWTDAPRMLIPDDTSLVEELAEGL
jgi:ribosome-associated protein